MTQKMSGKEEEEEDKEEEEEAKQLFFLPFFFVLPNLHASIFLSKPALSHKFADLLLSKG